MYDNIKFHQDDRHYTVKVRLCEKDDMMGFLYHPESIFELIAKLPRTFDIELYDIYVQILQLEFLMYTFHDCNYVCYQPEYISFLDVEKIKRITCDLYVISKTIHIVEDYHSIIDEIIDTEINYHEKQIELNQSLKLHNKKAN